MTYQRFEDLPVWQTAADLYAAVAGLLKHRALRASAGFRDQLERAALSVSNNVAEGFERGTTNELLAFIYIARGSAGEVRSMLRLLLRQLNHDQLEQARLEQARLEQDPLTQQAGGMHPKPEISNLKSELARLVSLAESCSRQLRAWADSLQNSQIKGQRYLTDQTRREADQKQRAAEFQKQLLRNLPPTHPLRKQAEERGLI
jgi:four helix bundle protein